jgi:hypothetical protein
MVLDITQMGSNIYFKQNDADINARTFLELSACPTPPFLLLGAKLVFQQTRLEKSSLISIIRHNCIAPLASSSKPLPADRDHRPTPPLQILHNGS